MKYLFDREKVLRVKGSPGKEPGNTAELTSSSQHLITMSGSVAQSEVQLIYNEPDVSSSLIASTH